MPLDWIPLRLPLTVELPREGAHMPVCEFEVTRGAAQELVLKGTALGAPTPDAGRESPIPGSIDHPIRVECRFGAYVGELIWRGPKSWSEDGTQLDNLKTTATGMAERIILKQRDGKPNYVTEWLTNVPNERIWSRTTERETKVVNSRRRGDATLEDDSTRRSSARDHLEVTIGLPTLREIRFGVAHPEDKKTVDDVGRPGFLEFTAGPSGLPSDELRNSVRRSLEFLFGCGFGVLGWSECDGKGAALRVGLLYSRLAGGVGAPLPPALLHPQWVDGIDEQVVAGFITSYLDHEQHFDLNRVVWLYLHARNAPLDMAAGYVGAAFEIIRRGYYRLPENEARSRRLSPKAWALVLKSLRTQMDTLCLDDDLKQYASDLEKVKARLGELNQISGTRLNALFLEDLKLGYGDVEEKALHARNDAAHANPLGPEDYVSVLSGYRALHTLLARVVFAALRVDVQYFDYSALGFPNRRLAEHQGNIRTKRPAPRSAQ